MDLKLNNNVAIKNKNEGENVKMFKRLFKQEKGFTMIELIIVIAIIAILGAILIPNFTSATEKAKAKADVASVKEINRQLAIYNAEYSKWPAASSAADLIDNFADDGYLPKDTATKPQTAHAKYEYNSSTGMFVINVNGTSEYASDAFSAAITADRNFITNHS